MVGYAQVDGCRVAPGAAAALRVMGEEFRSRFGCELLVTSGTRTHEEQIDIFLSAYRAQETGGGPFGDVRWWNGVRYVRYDPSGTVAQPGTSLHESDRALDLRDSGVDAGVASGGNERADWLRHNCPRWGFAANGYGFGEPWHYEYQDDPWDVPEWAAGKIPTPAPVVFEEDEMRVYEWAGHAFAVGDAVIYHLPTVEQLAEAEAEYGPRREKSDAGFGTLLLTKGIPWGAVDFVLRAPDALSSEGTSLKFWSRELAEGVAARGGQALAQKTLDEVLATAQQIAPPA